LNKVRSGIWIVVFFWVVSGCGYKTNPRPATATVPGEIGLVNALAYVDRIILRWDVPASNTDGSPFKDVSGFKIYRADQKIGEECENCEDKKVVHANVDFQNPSNAVIKKGEVLFTDKLVTPGHTYFYSVSAYNLKGMESRQSQDVTVVFDKAPPAPDGLRASVDSKGVRLTWGAPADRDGIRNYRVYRAKSGDAEDMIPLGSTKWAETSFLDREAQAGGTYYYSVRSLKMNRGISLESAPSATEKVFVSAVHSQPPENVNTASTSEGIRIYWEPVKIQGEEIHYNVYRSDGGRLFQRINPEPVRNPWFVDKSVVKDRTYRYAITAFPKNKPDEESSRSGSAAIKHSL
jgi:fibronectin type 3 domain-containing protein